MKEQCYQGDRQYNGGEGCYNRDPTVGGEGCYHEDSTMGESGVTMEAVQWGRGCYHGDKTVGKRCVTINKKHFEKLKTELKEW